MISTQERLQEAAMRLFAQRGVTQVTVSELAQEADVARGTVYNNFKTVASLFEEVATRLTAEMNARVLASLEPEADPAQRLSDGMRLFVRRAHEDPVWGRFIVRFGTTTPTLRALLEGAPSLELQRGMTSGRFQLRPDQLPSAVAMLSGAVLGTLTLVLEGHRTWRDAGSDMAELLLRALGVANAEALAQHELPPLAVVPAGMGEF